MSVYSPVTHYSEYAKQLLHVDNALNSIQKHIDDRCWSRFKQADLLNAIQQEKDEINNVYCKILKSPCSFEQLLVEKCRRLEANIQTIAPGTQFLTQPQLTEKVFKNAVVTPYVPDMEAFNINFQRMHMPTEYDEALRDSLKLDRMLWSLQDAIKDGPFSDEFIQMNRKGLREGMAASGKKALLFMKTEEICRDSQKHYLRKLDQLADLFNALKPVCSLKPSQLIYHLPPLVSSMAPPESTVFGLNRISFFLRHGRELDALQEFDALPVHIQNEVYDALWTVRGRPAVNDPIGHENFGEISFLGKEPRCPSSPQQKACAVEWVETLSVVWKMIDALERNDKEGLEAALDLLPLMVQEEIYKKHWEVMGRPTPESHEEIHRAMSHPNFGRVSLLGLEARCDVPVEKKIQTCLAAISDLKEKNGVAQRFTEETKAVWSQLGTEVYKATKNRVKCEHLHALAGKIAPLFVGKEAYTQIVMDADYDVLAAEYVKTYPCLRPFFLQLINLLKMK